MLKIIKLLEKLKLEHFNSFNLGNSIEDEFNEILDLSFNSILQDCLLRNLLFELDKMNYDDEYIHTLFLEIKKHHNESIKFTHKNYNEYTIRAIPSISFRMEITKIIENISLRKLINLIKKDKEVFKFILTEISEMRFDYKKHNAILNIIKNELLLLDDNILNIDTKLITNPLIQSIIEKENNPVIKYQLKKKISESVLFDFFDELRNKNRKENYITQSINIFNKENLTIRADKQKLYAYFDYNNTSLKIEPQKSLNIQNIRISEFYDYLFIKEAIEKYTKINNIDYKIKLNRIIKNNKKKKFDLFDNMKRKVTIALSLLKKKNKKRSINIFYKIDDININVIKQMDLIVDNFKDENITTIFYKIQELLKSNKTLFNQDEKTINEDGIKLLKIMMKQ